MLLVSSYNTLFTECVALTTAPNKEHSHDVHKWLKLGTQRILAAKIKVVQEKD